MRREKVNNGGRRDRASGTAATAEPNRDSNGLTGYFEHEADIGVVGRGPTPEAAMELAARAMFEIMIDLDAVRPSRKIGFSFVEDDLELALLRWLNTLLGETRAAGIFPCRFRLERDGDRWRGECEGGALNPEIERGTEVKGATLTMAAVHPAGTGWEARCVVDI